MATKKLEVVIAGDAKGAASAMSEVEGAADGMSGKLKGIGEKLGPLMAAAGVAAGAALAKGVMDSFNLDGLQAKMGAELGLSPADAEALGAAAADSYAAGFGASMEDSFAAASAVQTAFGDSMDPKALEPLIGQATTLAEVFDIDVNEAMMAAGSMLKNGLVADGQEGLDLLATGLAGLAPAVRDEIISATNEYGKHFAALGISGEEAFAMFRAADGVIGVDKMGDALKELTIRATDMSSGSVAAYEAMGLSAEDMSAKMLAGGDTARGAMDQIVDGLLGIDDPVAQANAAIALFGTPIEDLGTDQIPTFLQGLQGMDAGMGDISGSAQEMADSINSGPAAAIEKLKRQALQKLTDFVGGTVIPMIESLVGWFDENRWAIGPIAGVIGTVLVGAFLLWAASAMSAAIATLAAVWPIILIGLAIAALVAGFIWAYQNVDWFRNAVDGLIQYVTQTLWPALQQVASFLVSAFSQAWQWASAAIGWLIDKGTELWTWFQANLLPILQTVASFLVSAFTSAWSAASTAVSWVVEKGTELYTWFSANVLPILESVGGYLVGAFTSAFNTGKDAIGFIVEKATTMWEFFNNNVKPVLVTIADYMSGAFSSAFDGAKAAIGFVVDKATALWNALNDVIDIARQAVDAVKSIPGAGVVGNLVGSIPGFAAGGHVPAGMPHIVGENGPELRIEKGPGLIIPNHKLGDYAASGGRSGLGGGSTVVQVTVEGSVVTERQLIDVVADGLEKDRRRNGGRSRVLV